MIDLIFLSAVKRWLWWRLELGIRGAVSGDRRLGASCWTPLKLFFLIYLPFDIFLCSVSHCFQSGLGKRGSQDFESVWKMHSLVLILLFPSTQLLLTAPAWSSNFEPSGWHQMRPEEILWGNVWSDHSVRTCISETKRQPTWQLMCPEGWGRGDYHSFWCQDIPGFKPQLWYLVWVFTSWSVK